MKDGYGRTIDYLRISVTDRCNLRCRYCMPPGGVALLDHGSILTFEEVARVAEAAVELGIRRFRISGGEPLVRRGTPALVAMLAGLPGVEAVSMTTNGLLLERHAEELARAGLVALNVSLDTLDGARMARLCGGGSPEAVLRGVDLARSLGLRVKLNAVMLRPLLDELPRFVRAAAERDLPLRFIEFMPLDAAAAAATGEETLPVEELRAALGRLGELRPRPAALGAGPSEYWTLEPPGVVVGVIAALSSPFCDRCNRIRLTADGRLKPCLASREELDIRAALRAGASRPELLDLLRRTVESKPAGHRLHDHETPGRAMSRIGG